MQNQTIDGVSRELLNLCYRALNGGDNKLTGMEHGQAFRELRALLDAPVAPQGEPVAVYQAEYLGEGSGGWSDVEYREFKSYVGKPDFRTRTLYAEQPDPSEQRARALLAEVIRGEPEAYETTFYPDRHGPNMTEWVERVRKELGQ